MSSAGGLLPMVAETFRNPPGGFARLRALNLPRPTLWQCLVLVVILSVLLAEGSNLLVGNLDGDDVPAIFASPFLFGGMQLGLLVLMVVLIHAIGRGMGGTGDLNGAILVVAWVQFIMVCLQIVQSVAILALPPLAWIIGLAGIVVFLWLLTALIAALHDFPSKGRVFGMIMFVMLGVALAMSVVLTALGLTVPRV